MAQSLKMLNNSFFARSADIVAQDLLGKILIRKINNQLLKAKIVETEAYFGNKDPASRAYKGKNKISEMMWQDAGKIMIYNVHMYKMFNIVTGKLNEPSAVLIRALEPINFQARCSGPGLLTNSLKIGKSLHGNSIISHPEISILDNPSSHAIESSNRIGVTQDLKIPLRFFIKDNPFVSK